MNLSSYAQSRQGPSQSAFSKLGLQSYDECQTLALSDNSLDPCYCDANPRSLIYKDSPSSCQSSSMISDGGESYRIGFLCPCSLVSAAGLCCSRHEAAARDLWADAACCAAVRLAGVAFRDSAASLLCSLRCSHSCLSCSCLASSTWSYFSSTAVRTYVALSDYL